MEKSAEAFRTISEVSELLETPAHVLRFWESRFTQVKPVKRAGGRRYYRPSDLALLAGIKRLLHDDGMTIRGVQKILREQGIRHVAALGPESEAAFAAEAEPEPTPPPRPGSPKPFTSPFGQTETRLWPAAPAPGAAATGEGLVPDPSDASGYDEVPEAPMLVDAQELPLGRPGNVLPMGRPTPVPPESPQAEADPLAALPRRDASHPPAAVLLRAMDALRIKGTRTELLSVFHRLADLRRRMGDAQDRDRR